MNTAQPTRSVRLVTCGYFDGERHHHDGPYAITVHEGRIAAITSAPGEPADHDFILPALVDCHVHCFLDGSLTDHLARKWHLDRGFAGFLATARANVRAAWHCGISLLRDGGDPYGVNDDLREELRRDSGALQCGVKLRSPSFALHRPGRYGSFLARPVGDDRELAPLVRSLALEADEIKVLLTGPIDFLTQAVTGPPQFDLAASRTIVAAARATGKTAFAHANGPGGIAIAIEAGFASIEHGYFIDAACLRRMAECNVAWTPTLSPVIAQRELARARGNERLLRCLNEILARHAESIARAAQLGVPLLCGSDAGSPGVPHGAGLLDEIIAMIAAGVPVDGVLRAATTTPRTRWNEPPALLVPGAQLHAVRFDGSPFAVPDTVRSARRLSL